MGGETSKLRTTVRHLRLLHLLAQLSAVYIVPGMANASPESVQPIGDVEADVEPITFAPLRSMNEFLLSSARFQWPDTQTPGKWRERVRKNLFYYEGNYLLLAAVILATFSVFRSDVFLGVSAIASGYCVYGLTVGNWTPNLRNDLQDVHLYLIYVAVKHTLDYYSYLYLLLPPVPGIVTLVLIHASMRMRNIQNKLFTFKTKRKKPRTVFRAVEAKVERCIYIFEKTRQAIKEASTMNTQEVIRCVERNDPVLGQQIRQLVEQSAQHAGPSVVQPVNEQHSQSEDRSILQNTFINE